MSASVSRPIRTMVSVSLALLCAGPGIAVAQRIEPEGAELRAPAALRAVRRRRRQVLSAVKGRRVDSVTSGGM